MAEIIPAILPQSYAELENKLGLVAGHAPFVQIDICDGGFVPSRTWPYLKGQDHDAIFEDIIAQHKALPHWEEIDFEFDLMVKGAYEKIPDFISAGASRIIVHKRSVDDVELMGIIRDYGKHSDELGPFDVELGIAVSPLDSPESIVQLVPNIHFVQVMGIDRIGYQGQSFDHRTIETVKALRQAYPELIISIDGGVSLETGKALIAAGANRLVVGSAIFGSDNVIETLSQFTSL